MQDYETMLSRLADLVLEREVIRYGSFTLSSGIPNSLYFDGRLLTTDPEGAYLIGNMITEFIKENPVAAVGGPSIGADPIVMSVTMAAYYQGLHIPTFMIRKQPKSHGMLKHIEGNFEIGSEVALVDDTCATGDSLLNSISILEHFGHTKVNSIYVVFNRRELQGDLKLKASGHDIITLVTQEDIIAAMNRKLGDNFAERVSFYPDFKPICIEYWKAMRLKAQG